jgi:hypothetical protein
VEDSLSVLACRNRHSAYQNNEFKTPVSQPPGERHGTGDAPDELF